MRLPVFRRSATNEPKHLSRRDMKRRRRRAHVRVAIVQLMTFLLCAQALLGTGVPQAMAADAAERAQWNETVAGIAKANAEEQAKDARAQGVQAQANNSQEQGAGKNASGGGSSSVTGAAGSASTGAGAGEFTAGKGASAAGGASASGGAAPTGDAGVSASKGSTAAAGDANTAAGKDAEEAGSTAKKGTAANGGAGDAATDGGSNGSAAADGTNADAGQAKAPSPRDWTDATDNLVLASDGLSFDAALAAQKKTLAADAANEANAAAGALLNTVNGTLDLQVTLDPAAAEGRGAAGNGANAAAANVLLPDDTFTVDLPQDVDANLAAPVLKRDGTELKLDVFQLDDKGNPTKIKVAEAVVGTRKLVFKVVDAMDTATGKPAQLPAKLSARVAFDVTLPAKSFQEKAAKETWTLQTLKDGKKRSADLAIPAKADVLHALGLDAAGKDADGKDADAASDEDAADKSADAKDESTGEQAAAEGADAQADEQKPATEIRPGNRDGAPGVNGSNSEYATFTTLWADNNDGARPSADQLTKDSEYQLTFSLPGDTKKYRLTEDDGVTVTKEATEKLGITQKYFDDNIKKDGHGPVTVRQTATNTYTASVDPVLPSGAWTYTQKRDANGQLMWETDGSGKKVPVYEDNPSDQKQISWYIDHVKQKDGEGGYKSRYETADAATYPNYVTENQKECLQLLKDVTYTVIAKLGNDNDGGKLLITTGEKNHAASLKWASNQTLTVEKATGGAVDADWVTGKSQDLTTLVKNDKVTITSKDGQTATYTASWPAYHPDGTPFMYSLTQDEEVLKHTEDYSKYLPPNAPIKSMDFFDYKQVWYNNADSPDHGSETGKLYEGGTMTVTNAGTTPFYGMKQWLDDNPSQRPETTYTLWRYAAKSGTTSAQAAQVTDQNGQYISLTRSAKDNADQKDQKEYISVELIAKYMSQNMADSIQFAKYDQDGYPYIYLLRETVPEGYERLFSKNGLTVNGDDNSKDHGEFADHRPSYYDHDFKIVTPTGIWSDEADSTRPEGDVSSYHNNVIINRRVGTTEVTQTKTWKVGSFQDQLKDVTVTFQAERLPKADVDVDANGVPTAKPGKTWEKIPESEGGVKTITDWSQEKLTQSVTGTFAKYDENGKPYVYRWVESNVEKPGQDTGFTIDEATQTSHFTLTLKDENGVDQMLSFTGTYDPDPQVKMIVNRYEDETTAKVDKIWRVPDGKGGYTNSQAANPYSADSPYQVPANGIKVQLFQNDTLVAADDKDNTFTLDGAEDTGEGRAITLKVGDKAYTAHAKETKPWHLEFTGLPKYDAGGSKYNYTVVETGTAGFTVTRTIDPTTNDTKIYNTPVGAEGSLTDIRITKDWVDGGNSSARLPIKVDLYAKQDLYASDAAGAQPKITAGTKINEQPIELNDENNWYYIARLTVYYVKGTDGTLKPINGVDMLADAFRIQEVNSDDYEVLTKEQVQQRVDAGTSAYSPVLQNWTDGNPRMFPKDKNKDGKPDDGYVYEVTYGVNRKKGSLEVTNRRLGLVNIEIDKTWKDGKFPGNRPASQFTIAAKDKAVTFTEGSDGRIIATIANGGGTYPLSKIGADENTLEPLTGKDVSISKDDATLTITVDPKLDHLEYEVYGLPKYDGQGFVIEYDTAEDITGKAGDYVSSLTDSDEIYSSWWHFSDQLNYSYENKRTGTKDVTFHTIWYDQYVKKVLNQRPDVYLTLYKRVFTYDKDGNTVDANNDGQPDFTLEPVTGYEDYQWTPQTEVKDNDGTVDDNKDGNYYQQATIRNLPKYDDQGREIVYYASAATNASDQAVKNLDYQPHYITDEQMGLGADDKPVSSEVKDAASAGVVDQALQNQQPADQRGKPGTNARGYAARESSTFDFKISNEIKGEGTKIWSNVPGIVDDADLPDISVYLQRRLADEGYPSTYPNSTSAGWSDPSVTNVDSNKKTYSVKTYADVTDKNKAEIQDGTTVLAWTHKVVKTGDHTYTYTFTNYGDNTGIQENASGTGSDAWGTPASVDPEILPRYDQYGRRYEYRTREVIDGLIDWAAAGAAAEIPGGVKFSELEQGAKESLYQKVYNVTHGETTSFSMANVYKPSQGKLTVKKIYPGDNRTAGDAFPDVTFHLYRYYIKGNGSKSNAQLVQTQTLPGNKVTSNDEGVTGSGTVTFDKVDIYAPNGQYWVYYVTEDKVNGYDGAAAMGDVDVNGTFDIDPDKTTGVVTSGDLATVPQVDGKFGNPTDTKVTDTKEDDKDTVDVTFKNTYKPDILKLTGGNKQWGDHGNAFSTRPKIEDFQTLIKLKRVGTRQGEEDVALAYKLQHRNNAGEYNPPISTANTLVWWQYDATDTNWYFDILNLERWAPDGTPWKYTVTEDGANGLLTGPGYSNNDGNGGYNKGTSGDTTTGSADIAGSWFNDLRGRVSVTKAWEGDNELLRPASVTMQLQARKKGSNDAWHKAGKYWKSLMTDAEKEAKISETSPISTEMVLTAQNNWTDSREKLPVKIGTTEIEYRVVETKIGDKGVTVNDDGTYTNAPGGNKTGKDFVYSYATEGTSTSKEGVGKSDSTQGWDTTTATVTNTLQSTSLTVTKTWDDTNNAWGTRPSVTFKLQRKVGNGAWAWVVPTGTTDVSETNALSVTIAADAKPSEATFENLPKYDPNGDEYTYRAVEVVPTGYTLEGGVAVDGSTDAQAAAQDGTSFTNKLDTVGLTGTKTWEVNGNTSAIPNKLDLTLTRKVEGGTYENVTIPDALKDTVAFTWTKSNDNLTWTYTISGLPKYNPSGKPYIYNVRETVPAGFSFSVAAGETNTTLDKDGNQKAPTITNTLKTGSVSLTKVDSKDESKQLNGAVFTLQKQGADGKTWSDLVTGLVTGKSYEMHDAGTALKNTQGSDGQTGVLSISGLALGTYRFVETAAPAGYQFDSAKPATSEEFTITTANSGTPKALNDVTNTSNSFTLDKVGADPQDGVGNVSLNSVTIELVKDSKSYARWTRGGDGKVSAIVWSDGDSSKAGVTSSDGSITGLPAGTYDVKEVAVPGDYVKTSVMGTLTLDAAGKVTVAPSKGLPNGASLTVDAAGAKVTLTDPVVKGSLKLTKTLGSEKGAPALKDAKFDLYRVGTGANGVDEKIATDLMTDKDGVINTAKSAATMTGSVAAYGRTRLLDGLLPGTYYFRETATTSGAFLPEGDAAKSTELTIPANGGDAGKLAPEASVTMANTPFSAKAQLTKVEAELQATPINGAVFKLEYQAPGSAEYATVSANLQSGNTYGLQWNADGTLLPSQVQKTASTGVLQFTNLKKGSYKLTEASNAGYDLPDASSNPITFAVVDANNGKTISLGKNGQTTGQLANTRKLGSASLKKTGKDGVALDGVTFKLQVKQGDSWTDTSLGELATGKSYDAGGKLNGAAKEDTSAQAVSGVLSVKGLPWGTYRFAETKALPGYSSEANGQPITSKEFTIDRSTVATNADLGTIANAYDASGSIRVGGTKAVTGPDGSNLASKFTGKFTFKLTGVDGAPVRVTGEGGNLESENSLEAKNAADGSVSFGDLHFVLTDLKGVNPDANGSRSKSFTYQVIESGSVNGVKNDEVSTKTFTVTVTDKGTGTLEVKSEPADGSKLFTFTNKYQPSATSAELHAQKILTGRDWQAGESFTFKLEAVGGTLPDGKTSISKGDVPMPQGAKDGAIVHVATNGDAFGFGSMEFTKPGTYLYDISEVAPTSLAPGMSYSPDTYRATVAVTDDGEGQLTSSVKMENLPAGDAAKATEAKVAGDPVASFTNTYNQLSQSWVPTAQKSYSDPSGANSMTAGKFTFQLKALDGAPLPDAAKDGAVTATNTDTGAVTFPAITFTDKGLGANGAAKTYHYEISEVKGNEAGMTYDPIVYEANVTVSLDKRVLKVSPVITKKAKKGGTESVSQPTFSNTYAPTAADVQLKAHKTLNGATLADKQFSFSLYEEKVSSADGANLIETQTNDANGDVAFKKLTFDHPGSYSYSIAEVVPADAQDGVKAGVKYDTAWKHVTVDVTLDKTTGKLEAQVTGDVDGSGFVQFTNTYTPGTAEAQLRATKTLTGQALAEGRFRFKLYEVDADGKVAEGAKPLQTKRNAADGNVTFDKLSGLKVGDHHYVIREVDDGQGGVTYDTHDARATVTVTDNSNGVATAKVTYDGGSSAPVFKNTYDASGSIGVAGSKAVTGSDGSDLTSDFADKFSFMLTGVNGAPVRVADKDGKLEEKESLTADNDAKGLVAFGELHFVLADLADVKPDKNGSRSKTFTYQVVESGTAAGVTNDKETTKTFRVTVTDDGSGKLKVTDDPGDSTRLFAFTNFYEATGSLTLTGTKTMTGRALTDADVYAFNVYEGDKAAGTPVSTGTSDASGRITFDKLLSYTLKDVGTHTYTVAEDVSALPGGVSAVTKARSFTVDVSDKGHDGKLQVTAAGLGDGNSVSFENAYHPTAATDSFSFKKVLSGRDLKEGEFSFELVGADGAPMPDGAKDGKATVKNAADGSVSFGSITYDSAGTYTYTVKEVPGSLGGITYDSSVYDVTVTVTDNGKGALHASHSITRDGKPMVDKDAVFNNTYKPGSASATLTASKALTGRDLKAGEFSFQVTEDDKVVAEATNGADGKVSFPAITYEAAGEHDYVISEVKGSEPGVAYDSATYKAHVSVSDDGEGALKAEVSYESGKAPVFKNTYAPGAVTDSFAFKKVLTGRDLKAGEFSFELTGKNGAPMPEGAKDGKATAKNGAVGAVSFGGISYDKAGTYSYSVREVHGAESGITYDSTAYDVTVTVTDDGRGALHATHVISRDGKSVADKDAVFINSYKPGTTSVALTASKTLVGRQLRDGEFTFQVTEGGKVVAEAKNSADGTVAFSAIAYAEAGEHDYEISEVKGDEPGVAYDGASHKAHVSVTDSGDGILKATATYPKGGIIFRNSYQPAPAQLSIPVIKTLIGRDWQPSDSFAFLLRADAQNPDGATLPKLVTTSITGASANHEARFEPITFTKTGAYQFQVSEVVGSEQGVAYDSSVKTVTVRVTDDGEGQLVATVVDAARTGKPASDGSGYASNPASAGVAIAGGPSSADAAMPLIFVNRFIPATYGLTIHKVDQDGKPLAGARFKVTGSFADGSTEKTVTSGADGLAAVALLSAGKEYQVKEDAAPTGYEPIAGAVKVKLDDAGRMSIAGDLPDGFALEGDGAAGSAGISGLRVTNRKTVIPPTVPKYVARALPQTGDPLSTTVIYAIAALGMASLAGGLRGLRRRMGRR